jgi:hypothetical protein
VNVTERDGSFRRLVQTVKVQQTCSTGKSRIPVNAAMPLGIHEWMKSIARARAISLSDLYNEAALLLITDVHSLLGDDLRLPLGALTLSGVLGLRELIDRPIRTPLRDLDVFSSGKRRTTLNLDEPVWNALMELSYRFGIQLRRSVPVHRLIELAAVWYLSEFDLS